MGQEWGATAPFLFFTDHNAELGRLVKEGRRHEFRHYAAFANPAGLEKIPDCQSEQTFLACKIDWAERDREPHAGTLRLYQALLRLRRTEPALSCSRRGSFEALALDDDSLLLRREADHGPSLWVVIRLRASGTLSLQDQLSSPCRHWDLILTTEDPPFAPGARAPRVDLSGPAPRIEFHGPGAILLRAWVDAQGC